jgi:uncharacterized cupin superfamily protein
MAEQQPRPIVMGPGEGQTVDNPAGGGLTYKARGGETGGGVTVCESTAAPGEGPPLHLHVSEDEFIYVLEGELVLKENDGETVLKPGDAAGWRANGGIGHCLVNRTDRDALYLEVGTRSKSEHVHYPDVDFVMERDDKGRRWTRKNGDPIKD